jgi:hypothetical protein
VVAGVADRALRGRGHGEHLVGPHQITLFNANTRGHCCRSLRHLGQITHGHLLAVGGELGQNVALGWCPAEDPVGVRGGEALVESERVGERAEFVSRLLHRD